ncbi:hypothetical protein [Xanthomonas virus PB119]|nr:hypothetical protein [Xanthomonas virus PB119]
MKKILIIALLLALAGCSRQVLPEERIEANPQIKAPSHAPQRFIDTEYGVVCYWHTTNRDGISCVKV